MAHVAGETIPHISSRGRHKHWPYSLVFMQAKHGQHQNTKQPKHTHTQKPSLYETHAKCPHISSSYFLSLCNFFFFYHKPTITAALIVAHVYMNPLVLIRYYYFYSNSCFTETCMTDCKLSDIFRNGVLCYLLISFIFLVLVSS